MKPSGPSYQSGNEVRFKTCPSCGHAKWGVSMNPDTEAWTCYACGAGGRGTATTAEALRRMMRPRVRVEWSEVPLPGWIPLSRTARKYLTARGVQRPEQYGLAELADTTRILVPYQGPHGRVIFWTTRYFMPDGQPKYVSAPGLKPLYVLPWWRPAQQTVIVEGPFDALAVLEHTELFDLGLDPEQEFNVIALGGKILTKTNRDDLRELAPGKKIILLDHDAMLDAMKLKSQLLNASVVTLPKGMDPASIAEESSNERSKVDQQQTENARALLDA
jgi:hypothetical protein